MYNIKSVSIDVTYACNLRCKHCFNYSGVAKKGELTDDEIIKIASDIGDLSVESVCFCGGETLLRYELLKKSCKAIKSKSKQTTVNLVTNALMLTRERAKGLKEAGFFMVQISLDGFSDFSYDAIRQTNGKLNRVLEGITNAKNVGLEVSISALPHRYSLKEFKQIIDFCIENDLYELRCQPFMPLGRGKENFDELALTDEEYLELKSLFKTKEKELEEKKVRTKISWGDPVDHYFMLQQVDYMPFITINAFGEIEVTPYLPFSVYNLKKGSLKGFIDKNIPEKAIKHPLIMEHVSNVFSIDDMYYDDKTLPKKYIESNLDLSQEVEDILL